MVLRQGRDLALDPGEIENRFEDAATAASTAAQAAFDRAFEDDLLSAPDLGLTEAANRVRRTLSWQQRPCSIRERRWRQSLGDWCHARMPVVWTG
ncbi:hypothetical protein J1C49_15675 [Cognatishimia sp. F0-27]|nr:hypothetical protein [Cognatishimia sp. F0-27]